MSAIPGVAFAVQMFGAAMAQFETLVWEEKT
jgi:hypothetical protein